MKIDEHGFFARNLNQDYPMCVKGEGVWIWDEDGKKYLDACSGANVSSIGHGVKEIGEAMKKQADQIAYVPPQHFFNKPTIELCKKLLEHAPKQYTRIMLCSGGSEAIENALKIARQYHVYRGHASKYMTISRWQGFHGNTIVADSVGGTTSRRKISGPMLMGVEHIPSPNCYHCYFGAEYPKCNIRCAQALENSILQNGPENISSFICEPVVGSASAATTPVPEYFTMVRKICDQYDVLWIDDEIMAGSGRTGKFMATEHFGAYADIVVMAKGLSCGYVPLSAIFISEKVFAPFYEKKLPYIGGHTFNAHPVTAAVGIEILNYMDKHRIYEGVESKGKLLDEGLRKLMNKHKIIGDVRGLGLFMGIEFVKDRMTRQPFDPEINVTPRILSAAMKNGLIVYASRGCMDGKQGDGLLICPPLTINEEEIRFVIEVLDRSIAQVVSELKEEGSYEDR